MRPSKLEAAVAAAIGALLGAGWGPAPYAAGPEEPGDPPGPAVVVVVGDARAEPPAQQPSPAPAQDHWIPETFPRPNPFLRRRTWVGDYDCTQGNTELVLRIMDVRGKRVRAVFDFHHVPSGAAGKYIVGGTFDGESGRVLLVPGPWIDQPDGYVPVGMDGEVSLDGRRFDGKIPFPGCGMFRLRALR